eukprot:999890-Rhodomonas_salina.4
MSGTDVGRADTGGSLWAVFTLLGPGDLVHAVPAPWRVVCGAHIPAKFAKGAPLERWMRSLDKNGQWSCHCASPPGHIFFAYTSAVARRSIGILALERVEESISMHYGHAGEKREDSVCRSVSLSLFFWSLSPPPSVSFHSGGAILRWARLPDVIVDKSTKQTTRTRATKQALHTATVR